MDRHSTSPPPAEGQLQVHRTREREVTLTYPDGQALPQLPDAPMSPKPRATSGAVDLRRTSSRTPHRPKSPDSIALRAGQDRAITLAQDLTHFQQEHRRWAENAQQQAQAEMQAGLQSQMKHFENVAQKYSQKLVEFHDAGRSELGQAYSQHDALRQQNAQLAANYQTQFDSTLPKNDQRQAEEI